VLRAQHVDVELRGAFAPVALGLVGSSAAADLLSTAAMRLPRSSSLPHDLIRACQVSHRSETAPDMDEAAEGEYEEYRQPQENMQLEHPRNA
jgi:hypothetical protein